GRCVLVSAGHWQDRERVDTPLPRLDPFDFLGMAFRAEGPCRPAERSAGGAARHDDPALGSGLPERFAPGIHRDFERGKIGTDAARRHRSFLRMAAVMGVGAGPPVTSAVRASLTWFTAVPRSCSTASRICVMPTT